jgi:hypothetical protein
MLHRARRHRTTAPASSPPSHPLAECSRVPPEYPAIEPPALRFPRVRESAVARATPVQQQHVRAGARAHKHAQYHTRTHSHLHMHERTHTRAHTQTHARTNTKDRTRTRTHTHAHTHAPTQYRKKHAHSDSITHASTLTHTHRCTHPRYLCIHVSNDLSTYLSSSDCICLCILASILPSVHLSTYLLFHLSLRCCNDARLRCNTVCIAAAPRCDGMLRRARRHHTTAPASSSPSHPMAECSRVPPEYPAIELPALRFPFVCARVRRRVPHRCSSESRGVPR